MNLFNHLSISSQAFEAVKQYRLEVYRKTGAVPSLPDACKAVAQANPHTFGQVGWIISHANKACVVPCFPVKNGGAS